MITAGADVLDAVVAGVTIIELDPEDTSVGYGGLPSAGAVAQMDASVMRGPWRIGSPVARAIPIVESMRNEMSSKDAGIERMPVGAAADSGVECFLPGEDADATLLMAVAFQRQ